MSIRPNQCIFCIHYRRGGLFTCTAFPGGIPEPILEGKADHRYPYPGDHGVRFLRAPDVNPERWPLTRDLPAPADIDVGAPRA